MKQHERVAVEEEVSALNKEADQEMDDLLASVRCLQTTYLT